MRELQLTAVTAVLTLMLAACGGSPVGSSEPLALSGQERRFAIRLENTGAFRVLKSGLFNTPVGAASPRALAPGDRYEFSVTAARGHSLSFATMLTESNDWFLAPGPQGIPLWGADGRPVSGDVTEHVSVWNAGTEVDQEPAVGLDTAPSQAYSEQGAADPTSGPGLRGRSEPRRGPLLRNDVWRLQRLVLRRGRAGHPALRRPWSPHRRGRLLPGRPVGRGLRGERGAGGGSSHRAAAVVTGRWARGRQSQRPAAREQRVCGACHEPPASDGLSSSVTAWAFDGPGPPGRCRVSSA